MRSDIEKFKNGIGKAASLSVKVFLVMYAFMLAVFGTADYLIPERMTVFEDNTEFVAANAQAKTGSYTVTAKLFGVVPVKNVDVNILPETKLVPCGKVFGVKFFTKGVIVINLADIETKDGTVSPAKLQGLSVGDVIYEVDGKEINTVEALSDVFAQSHGKEMKLKLLRDGKEIECSMKAVLSLSDKTYKTGIWVRDSTAGIGTMTYYNPSNNSFAGLGHGICDVDTGKLMPLLRGSIVNVDITDIIKGRRGSPGEIKGSFGMEKKGTLTGNTSVGVYGLMDNPPESAFSEPVSVATANQVHEGRATIYSELDDEGIKEYEIEISGINKDDENSKNFVITITDDALLEKTGGIVQGMSGSPVMQDGRLVGAITHVLVNDPTKGYGIFIENMLFHSPELLK